MQLRPEIAAIGTPVKLDTQAGEYVGEDPSAAPKSTPKFLLRDDGVLFPYSDTFAKDPRFKPRNTMPPAHVKAIQEAARRDEAEYTARVRYQAAEKAKQTRILEQAEEQRQAARAALMEMSNTVPANEEEEFESNVFIIANADFDALQKFVMDNDLDIVLNKRAKIDTNRAKVRAVAEAKFGAPAVTEPVTPDPEPDVEETAVTPPWK